MDEQIQKNQDGRGEKFFAPTTAPINIPTHEFHSRRQRAQKAMSEHGLDGLVILGNAQQESHLRYLTNHHIQSGGNNTPDRGCAAYVLLDDGDGVLVAPSGVHKDGLVNVGYAISQENLVQATIEVIKKCAGTSNWGIVGKEIAPSELVLELAKCLPSLAWQDAGDILDEQRMLKSEAEIQLLQRAAQIAGRGIQAGLNAAVPGAAHADVEKAARQACLLSGADDILALCLSGGSGPLSSDPTIILCEDNIVHLEISGRAAGYGFNMSRLKVLGRPTGEQIDLMEHLAEAAEWMIETLQPNKRTTFYFTESRGRTILAQAYGIGLEIEEKPQISIQRSMTPLPGMALCVAPAVTSKEFGSVTIKEMVAIGESGPQILGDLALRIY